MTPKRSMVTLSTPEGAPAVTVEADVYGVWAITPGMSDGDEAEPFVLHEDFWAVTHAPSGRAVGPWGYRNRDAVVRLAKALHERCNGPGWEENPVDEDLLDAARTIWDDWLEAMP